MASLSIIIPTRSFAPIDLVRELQRECSCAPECDDYEIIVTDDGTTSSDLPLECELIHTISHACFLPHEQHQGKAALLNDAIGKARYDLLLFVDNDARLHSPGFISRYLQAAEQYPLTVICGGVFTSVRSLTPHNTLRYRYERAANRQRQSQRQNRTPYSRFTTFNVLMPRDVVRRIPFNESIRRYGYEDVVMGLDLCRQAVPVVHIDNALVHTGIDSNSSFLQKTETALQVLSQLPVAYQDGVTLVKTLQRLESLHLVGLIRLWHRLFHGLERANLLSRHPSLLLFRLYKLGYYLELTKS